MKYVTETYATGKCNVMRTGEYPQRIGHITGGKEQWLAERGGISLGYFKTRKAAKDAIVVAFEAMYKIINGKPHPEATTEA